MDGRYAFGGWGFNWRAIVALLAGILPNLPGFLHSASNGAILVPAFLATFYTYAWFNSLLVAGVTHTALSRLFPVGQTEAVLAAETMTAAPVVATGDHSAAGPASLDASAAE